MNDVQKFVNGILRNHSMHKRYIAVLTALSMVVSIVVTSILVMPADSKAGSLICEKTEHIHDESCKKLVCGLDEVIYDEVTTEAVSQAIGQFVQLAQLEGETVGDAKTEASVEVTESSEVVEGTECIIEATEETVVSESAGEISEDTNEDTVPQVTESVQHIHTDECYMYVCGFEEHTHSEDCYESVEVDPTPDEVDSYMINQNAFDVFNVFGRPMHLLYNDVSATGEFSTENNPDSTMPVNPGAILGVATHFHVLAEEASFESHVHGNVATNYLVKCGAFGVYLNKLAGKSSVNYIRNFGEYAPLNNAFQTKLVLGSRYAVEQKENDNRYRVYERENPSNEFYIPIGNFPEGGSMNENVEINDNYINVTKELDKFADMSRAIAAKPSKDTVFSSDSNPVDMNTISDKVVITDNGTELYTLDFSKITDKYIYYTLDLTGNDKNNQPLINFSTCSKVLEIKGITEDKFLFLTVDVGNNENVAFNKSWRVYRADNQEEVYGTGEVPLDDGSCRVIYNIVNSTDSNGVKEYTPFGEKNEMPTDSKIILGEQKNGTFLVPRGYVNCAGNTNGTIIAYKYVATGESHRADIQFEDEEVDDVDCPTTSENVTESEGEGGESTTPEEKKISITVNKVWSDGIENGNHSGDNVTIQLYKGYEAKLDVTNNDLINNGTLSLVNGTNQITLNQGNNWTAKFEGLPVKEKMGDQTEKLIYYYIKEVDVTGYTATYSANGLNTVDRTVTVRNVKLMDLVIKKQWHKSDGTLITASDVDDNNNNILSSMPSVECTLYKSNIHLTNNLPTDAKVLETFSIGGNAWQYTKAQLPTEEDGKPLYYYVMEKPVDGYNVSYENVGYLGSESIIVKNTQKASGTISLTVNKRWLATDIDGVIDYTSPVKAANKEVTVELQKSTDASNWVYVTEATFTTSYTFTNLPKQENNTAIYYRVKEKNVPYGYQDLYSKTSVKAQDVTDNGEVTITVTNTLIKNSLVINKNWHNGSEGVSSIIVEVYRKLAGYNPSISGTGESVPEDDPIIPPSQGENPNPDDSSTVQGTVDANGVLNFPEKTLTEQNDTLYYDLTPYENRRLKTIKIYSNPVDSSNNVHYSGKVTIASQTYDYSGQSSGSVCTIDCSGNQQLVVGNIYNSIKIEGLNISNGSNTPHTITKIEVTFYEGKFYVSNGQLIPMTSFVRNNWLLFDSSPSDTVTYNEETNVLTVEPIDGSFVDGVDGIEGKTWRYTIPTNYYTYNISKVKIFCDEESSGCSGVILVSGNDENGIIWNQDTVSGGSYTNNIIEYSDLNYSMDKYNCYSIYLRNYYGANKVEKLEITFSINSENDGEDKDEDDPVITPPSDTVTFDETNKILTVIPSDGSLSKIDEGGFNGWLYKIPTEYYNYNITNVKITRSDSGLTSGVIYISRNNDGKFSWDGRVDGESRSGNTIELSGANYSLSNYDGYGVCLRDDNSSSKVQKLEITFATKDSTPQYTQGNTIHNFTTNGTSSSFYTISGNLSSDKGTVTYNNLSLTQCLKIESSTNISFTNSNAGTVTLVFSSEAKDKKIKIDGTEHSIVDNGSGVYTLVLNLSAGTHTIQKANDSGSNVNLYYMSYADTQSQPQPDPIHRYKDIYLNNVTIEELEINDTEQYVLTNSELSEFSSKSVSKVEITYKNDLSTFPDYQKDTNLWLQGPNGWIGGEPNKIIYDISGKVAKWEYTIPVAVSDLTEIAIRTCQSPDINNIKATFSDGSTYTVTNKCYNVYNTTVKNEKVDVTIAGDNNDNASIVNLNNYPLSDYKGKYLDYIQVYLKNSYNEVPANEVVNLYIHNSNNYGTVTQINRNQNGNITTYNYGGVATHDAVNLRSDFFRLKTTINTEIQKVVLVFSDNSTFTMNNKSYVASTTPSTKLEQSKEVEIQKDTAHIDLITQSNLSDYTGRKITKLETYYTSANDVNLNTTKIYLRNTSGNDSGNNGQGTNNNIGYFNYNSRDLSEFDTNLLYINTSVNEKIEKIVFTFDGGTSYESTYTLINTLWESYDKPEEPEEPKQVHLSSSITLTKITDFTTKSDGNPTVEHEQFGFADETIRSQYLSKYANRVDIYYRDMLIGFPDYLSDTAIYLIRSGDGANKYPYEKDGKTGHYWCPDQTDYNFDDNIATWYYKEELADDLGEKFFRIKTSRPDEISKIVINFTDGSTYTMNNTAYVASSKVESSEDDYTYNTGEYVLIAKITLTADGGWRQTLDNLPATDGQGNAYTYHIKETNIYGSDADKYKVLSYTHANGIVLENDSNDIGVTNERKADENINVLPNTGGTGAKGYFVAGIIVMICSAAGYTVIKRRLIR